MNEAIEWLESDQRMRDLSYSRGRSRMPAASRSEFENATVLTYGGVTATRPMFELFDDHETGDDGRCWLCREGTIDERGILQSVRET